MHVCVHDRGLAGSDRATSRGEHVNDLPDIEPHLRSEKGRPTRQESLVLGAIHYLQPATAYRIRRAFADSITARLGASAGAVYAIVRRLVAGGMVLAKAVEENARGAELLTLTDEGRRALRNWVRRVDPEDLVIEDPVRSKMLAIDLLDPDEAIEWLGELVEALDAKVAELEQFALANSHLPHRFDLHDNARTVLIARLEWARRIWRRRIEERAAS